jgi:uncharacterized membrane protein YoaK (UPF0700 family)
VKAGPAPSDGAQASDVIAGDAARKPLVPKASETRLRVADVAREAERLGIDLAQAGLAPPEPAEETPTPGLVVPRAAPSVRPEASTDTRPVEAALFGLIAGYVDTVGFLALFGMFTAHITGDLVASVAELSQGSIARHMTMVPIFMISVVVATVLARRTRRDPRGPLFPLLALMTVALVVFGVTGLALEPFMIGPANWAVGIVGATGVAAMAIQNMIMRDALHSWTPTTIMTGNLTQVTIQLVELVFAAMEREPDARARLRRDAKLRLVKFGLPLAGFVAGTFFGAWLTRLCGFWSVVVPAAVVAGMTVWHWRRARRVRA